MSFWVQTVEVGTTTKADKKNPKKTLYHHHNNNNKTNLPIASLCCHPPGRRGTSIFWSQQPVSSAPQLSKPGQLPLSPWWTAGGRQRCWSFEQVAACWIVGWDSPHYLRTVESARRHSTSHRCCPWRRSASWTGCCGTGLGCCGRGCCFCRRSAWCRPPHFPALPGCGLAQRNCCTLELASRFHPPGPMQTKERHADVGAHGTLARQNNPIQHAAQYKANEWNHIKFTKHLMSVFNVTWLFMPSQPVQLYQGDLNAQKYGLIISWYTQFRSLVRGCYSMWLGQDISTTSMLPS